MTLKKIRMVFLAGTGTALLLSSGHLYARYMDSVSVINHVETGDVDIGITEYKRQNEKVVPYTSPEYVYPGDTISKIPRITNYANTCWVRTKITFLNSDESKEGLSLDTIGGLKECWKKAGEYYYCTNPLKRGESVDLFETVTIPAEWNAEHSGQKLSIDIQADAIQTANFQPDFEAMSPWGNQKIELCVHKKEDEAAVSTEKHNNTVEYSGDAHKLVAAPDDFFGNLDRLMPGDKVSDSVEIKNTTKKEAEIFFFAGYEKQTGKQVELLKALEIQIQYNGNTIYKGKLTEDKLNKGISLGKFAPGTGGRMDFYISMPSGLGNAYARRDADVKWIFRVQEDDPKPSATPSPRETPTITNTPGNPGSQGSTGHNSYCSTLPGDAAVNSAPVKTGDENSLSKWTIIISVAAALICIAAISLKRRKDHEA